MEAKAAVSVDPLELVSELIQTGNVDTVYRDVYLQRARTLMMSALPVEEFRRIEQARAELATLPIMIGRALDSTDWRRVKELSSRGEALRRSAEGKHRQIVTAREVYVGTDVRLDPFSPGLLTFTRLGAKDLPALRTRTIERLARLEVADAPWKDFYSGRLAAWQALVVNTSESSNVVASMDPREAAQRALKAGDLNGLVKLADKLMAAVTPAKVDTGAPGVTAGPIAGNEHGCDLLTPYSEATLKAGRRLGLAARRLESRMELAALRQYAWNPLVPDGSGPVKLKQVPLPAGTPEGFRERLEMLMIHPLVNSGGARHLPTLLAEDVLVEDFADPKDGDELPASELLTSLGLPGRRGLRRIAIEEALLARGAGVLSRELGLDPRVFRLVCIPPDVHLRLAEAEHWGHQPLWTHFDGYLLLADGRLQALAGGDVRAGGQYDVHVISLDCDSDRVIARFAAVRRERMVAW